MNPVIWKIVILVCLRNCVSSELSSWEEAEITETCCKHGETYALTSAKCSGVSPPADVERDQTEMCLASASSCCETQLLQKAECDAGIKLAANKRCSTPNSDIGKMCCDECSFGQLSGESQGRQGCGEPSGDGYSPTSTLRNNAYYKCCIEAAKEIERTTEKKKEPTTTSTTTTQKPKEKCKTNSCEHICLDEDGPVRCECRPGYRLQPDNKSCKDINECSESLDDLCMAEDIVCHNTEGSFKCVPLKKRDVGLSCPPGFKRNVQNQVCDDINECQLPRTPCPKYLCENTIGGYKCAGKPGTPFLEDAPGVTTAFSSTTPSPKIDICPPGFRSGPEDECIDIDECGEHLDDCQRLSQYCINTHGSFFCQDHVSKRCSPGFKVNAVGVCEDIDECVENSEICRRTEVCINLPGAYNCKSKITTLPKLSSKTCQEGTRMRAGGSVCEDIDECREGTHLCDHFQNCINTFGGHECRCKKGFELDSVSGSCTDVDECALKLDDCASGLYCLNLLGSFTCKRRLPTAAATSTTSTALPPVYDYEYYDSEEETIPKPDSPPQLQPIPSRPQTITTPRLITTPHPTTTSARPATTTARPTTTTARPTTTTVHPTTTTVRPTTTTARPTTTTLRPTTTARPYTTERTTTSTRRTTTRSRQTTPTIPTASSTTIAGPPRRYPQNPRTRPNRVRPRPEYNPMLEIPIIEITTPKITASIASERKPDGSFSLDTNDIPKGTWTNVRGKESDVDFDPNNLYCLNGYEKNELGQCVDTDECEINRQLCGALEVCRNKAGGYECECVAGFTRDSTGWCVAATVPSTTPTTARPNNIRTTSRSTTSTTTVAGSSAAEGSFAPPSYGRRTYTPNYPLLPPSDSNCDFGYTYNNSQGKCVDVDECATHKATCGANEDCVNKEGGYQCVCGRRCRAGAARGEAAYPTAPESRGQPSVITVGSQYGVRGTRYVRPNQSREAVSGAVVASCPWGYQLTPVLFCLDIDECEQNISECGPQQRCENFYGGYSCQCPSGHRFLDGRCEDIDECAYSNTCPYNARCINTVGSYRCECGDGFQNAPSNDKVCVDVDECAERPNLCEHGCINSWGGYRCFCNKGHRLQSDNRTCVDVDECAEYGSGRMRLCGGQCVNTQGSYRCACPSGYRLADDLRSCIDIDECENGQAQCASPASGGVCQNTRGSYHCHRISCPPGYRLEGKHKCTRVQNSCQMSDWNCIQKPTSYSYNFITFVANIFLPKGSVDLFTMHGPSWQDAVLNFEMKLLGVQAGPGVKPADLSCFNMRPTGNLCVISLQCSLGGPQVVELELSMSLYQRSLFGGSAVARLIVIVSEYEF